MGVVAGMVASVRYLLTKDGRSFAVAALEDLDGQVEVMVWPRVYAETSDLWQEGSILLVEGKVRLKEDNVQLNCDGARIYQLTEPVQEEAAAQPVPAAASNESAEVKTAPAARDRLMITIGQTGDKDGDLANLYQLVAVLKEYPGQDEVKLSIANGGSVTHLKLPNLYTGYCPELGQRLAELVGENGYRFEMVDRV